MEFSVLSGKRIGVLKGHSKAVTALKLNSNVDLLASGIKIFSLHKCSFFIQYYDEDFFCGGGVRNVF